MDVKYCLIHNRHEQGGDSHYSVVLTFYVLEEGTAWRDSLREYGLEQFSK